MSSVDNSSLSDVAHPVLFSSSDVRNLISSGCGQVNLSEVLQYNKAAYQAYVSVLHSVINPGGSISSRSGGVLSSRSSLLSSDSESRGFTRPPSKVSNFGMQHNGSAFGSAKNDAVSFNISALSSGREVSNSDSPPRSPGSRVQQLATCGELGVGSANTRPRRVGSILSSAPGHCYGKLFRASRVDDILSVVGSWPTLESILSRPVRDFRALTAIDKFSFYLSGDKCHLDLSGTCDGGVPVLDAFKSSASAVSYPVGSMGSHLAELPGLSVQRPCSISSAVRVGGKPRRVDSLAGDDVLVPFSTLVLDKSSKARWAGDGGSLSLLLASNARFFDIQGFRSLSLKKSGDSYVTVKSGCDSVFDVLAEYAYSFPGWGSGSLGETLVMSSSGIPASDLLCNVFTDFRYTVS